MFLQMLSKPPIVEGIDVLTPFLLPCLFLPPFLSFSFLLSLLRFVYETEHFNGVAELLEILGR